MCLRWNLWVFSVSDGFPFSVSLISRTKWRTNKKKKGIKLNHGRQGREGDSLSFFSYGGNEERHNGCPRLSVIHVSASQCMPVPVSAHQCPSLPVSANQCLLVSISSCQWQISDHHLSLVPVSVCQCLSVCPSVPVSVSISSHQCPPVAISACQFLFMPIGTCCACQCLWVTVSVFQCPLMLNSVCECPAVFATACQCVHQCPSVFLSAH